MVTSTLDTSDISDAGAAAGSMARCTEKMWTFALLSRQDHWLFEAYRKDLAADFQRLCAAMDKLGIEPEGLRPIGEQGAILQFTRSDNLRQPTPEPPGAA